MAKIDEVVFFIRHGASNAYERIEEDEDKPSPLYRQKWDSPLGPTGNIQAAKTGDFVGSWKREPNVLFCSTFKRAEDTAQEIAKRSKTLFPNSRHDLREIDRVIDGAEILRVVNEEEVLGEENRIYRAQRGEAFRTMSMDWRYDPSDESIGDGLLRQSLVKHDLENNYQNQSVMIVGHSQSGILLLASMILGDNPKPFDLFSFFNRHFMKNCSITRIIRQGNVWSMKDEDFNFTDHLK